MDKTNQNTEQEEPRPAVVVGNPPHKHWLVWVLMLLLVLSLAASGWLWSQLQTAKQDIQRLQREKQQLQSQTADSDADSSQLADGEEQACNDTPTAAMKDNIKAALDSQNTAAFATYFSNPVMFVLAASEKGGNETPDQAAVDMEYANTATGPWDFSLPQATLDDYDAGFYTDYFDANTYVGRATTGQVAAFDFDCDGKINKAFLAAHEDLL